MTDEAHSLTSLERATMLSIKRTNGKIDRYHHLDQTTIALIHRGFVALSGLGSKLRITPEGLTALNAETT